jgi:hypothetical protein
MAKLANERQLLREHRLSFDADAGIFHAMLEVCVTIAKGMRLR